MTNDPTASPRHAADRLRYNASIRERYNAIPPEVRERIRRELLRGNNYGTDGQIGNKPNQRDIVLAYEGS